MSQARGYNISYSAFLRHCFSFMLDGRVVEALFEIFERGFYILSVALAWGGYVDAFGTPRVLTTQEPWN